jgi:hypothetical protein
MKPTTSSTRASRRRFRSRGRQPREVASCATAAAPCRLKVVSRVGLVEDTLEGKGRDPIDAARRVRWRRRCAGLADGVLPARASRGTRRARFRDARALGPGTGPKPTPHNECRTLVKWEAPPVPPLAAGPAWQQERSRGRSLRAPLKRIGARMHCGANVRTSGCFLTARCLVGASRGWADGQEGSHTRERELTHAHAL